MIINDEIYLLFFLLFHLEKNIFYFNCSFPLRDLVDSVVGVWIWEHQRVPGGTIIYTQLGGRRLHGDDGECFGEKKMVNNDLHLESTHLGLIYIFADYSTPLGSADL